MLICSRVHSIKNLYILFLFAYKLEKQLISCFQENITVLIYQIFAGNIFEAKIFLSPTFAKNICFRTKGRRTDIARKQDMFSV